MLTGLLIALLLLALLGLPLAVAAQARVHRAVRPANCVIVLGARVWPDGRMSNVLINRCEKALWAYRAGLGDQLILCGGRGKNEPLSEAEAMKSYLLKNAVPEARIHCDTASVRTRENLENALTIMRRLNCQTAVIVTTDYHVRRALWLATDLKISACALASAPSKRAATRLRALISESLSWILYFFERNS